MLWYGLIFWEQSKGSIAIVSRMSDNVACFHPKHVATIAATTTAALNCLALTKQYAITIRVRTCSTEAWRMLQPFGAHTQLPS